MNIQDSSSKTPRALGNLRGWRRSDNRFDFESTTGGTLRLDVLQPGLVRVRMAPAGRFADSLNMRWVRPRALGGRAGRR